MPATVVKQHSAKKKGTYEQVQSDSNNKNLEGIDNDEDLNISRDDHDDEGYESDPLVLDEEKDHNAKSKKTKRDVINWTYERQDDSDAVMCNWVGMIVMLGIFVAAGFLYWNHTKHHFNGNNDLGAESLTAGNIRTRPPRPRAGKSHINDDDDGATNEDKSFDKDVNPKQGTFYFDPFAAIHTSNPLDFSFKSVEEYYAQTLVSPVWDPPQDSAGNNNIKDDNDDDRLGYMMEPDIVNGTVAFVCEGDLYLASWRTPTPPPSSSSSISAMKLTTTVGNVRNPKINPLYHFFIAYTATYTGRRDVYLLDLRRRTHGSQPAMRLTYWSISAGVRGLVGWKDGGKTLVFQAYSNEVSMQDVRMYELTVAFDAKEETTAMSKSSVAENSPLVATILHPQVLQTNPVPLSQALEGAYQESDSCWYFTRFQQSSNTHRYQGGTAEAIWSWCEDHELAVALTTHQFNGTSKAPSIFTLSADDTKQKLQYLLFLSDRGPNNDPNDPNKWKPTTMNLWAMPLPGKKDLAELANLLRTSSEPKIPSFDPSHMVQLTHVACEFSGMSLREYSLDTVNRHVVLRIGADLHWLSADDIQRKLVTATPSSRHLKPPNNEEVVTERNPTARNNNRQAAEKESGNQNATQGPQNENLSSKKSQSSNANRVSKDESEIQKLGILVYSDFHEHQERFISVDVPDNLDAGDLYETAFGTTAFLMTVRGQVWVAPVVEDIESMATAFTGAGRNMPPRRYRIAPGAKMGGAVRILACRHVPVVMEDPTFSRRLAVILATDPKSPTAEHAFYLVETQSDASPSFLSFEDLPEPFLGGKNGGGSVSNGGLGSVMAYSVRVSQCGRRMAWLDTDGRICAMTLPLYKEQKSEYSDYTVLPKQNELGEPFLGDDAELKWSPGGRYLAVEHSARNQFSIISVVDCGDPLLAGSEGLQQDLDSQAAGIKIGRIVQATPARFNSYSPYWGKSTFDQSYFSRSASLAETYNDEEEPKVATTTLFYLTDRDIVNKQRSPWGTRAPNPYFEKTSLVYALPLLPQEHLHETMDGHFPGGGATELYVERILDLKALMEKKEDRGLTSAPSQAPTVSDPAEHFPQDPDIKFGPSDLTFARSAYRLANIPESSYVAIVTQAQDDGSMLFIEKKEGKFFPILASVDDFPSDGVEMKEISQDIEDYGLGTSGSHLFVVVAGRVKVVPNSAAGLAELISLDASPKSDVAYTQGLTISVWPSLEYQQMYGDAWRMMRDYFYDRDMTGIDWNKMFERYRPLVRRCAKREELDDVLVQMASEVSALHVFVYGGEYNAPLDNDITKTSHVPASLGVTVQRSAEWKGFVVTSVPEVDPDYNLVDGSALYSPLSDRTLRMSGQQGLKVGDVIVSVNGESVMQAPDLSMLLRGMAYCSVRLGVLRVSTLNETDSIKADPVIAVPIKDPDELLYSAWEWKTRQTAKSLAEKADFTVGYAHLRSMGSPDDIDSFYRGFFPDFDKDAMIIDVRHNHGGNIDWWLLDVLQRRAWMYWQGRSQNATTGGLGWNEQFAFRGHIVVLIDEKTSSDGEGFSRGVSELGLGKLVGTRTWGGGIWLSSDNHLVDGGIASAPEIGTYNEKFGAGLGIEQMGVEPDIIVDNNPRTAYDGRDSQLEHAIKVLKDWIEKEPVVVPTAPTKKRNMALDETESCSVAP